MEEPGAGYLIAGRVEPIVNGTPVTRPALDPNGPETMDQNTLYLTVMFASALPLFVLFSKLTSWSTDRDRVAAMASWSSTSAPADLDPFGLNSLANMLMSDLDGAAGPTQSIPTAVTPDLDADNDHDLFDARDLVHVLDRVVTPVTVEAPNGDGYKRHLVHSVEANYYNDSVQLFDADDDHIETLSGYAQVELVGPVTVLDAPADVIAYVGDGELLCADHGAPFDIGVSDGAVSPVLDGQNDLEAVEFCSHWNGVDGGHSFCGQCGEHFEPAGHPDAPFAGPFVFCDNCSTRSVYVDGIGYRYCHEMDGFNSLPTDLEVRVALDADARIYPFGWSSILHPTPTGSVDAVVDASGRRFSASWGFVCYLDDDPSAGVLLVLSESTNNAWDEAVEHFEGALESALEGVTDDDEAEGIRSDHRAALQMIRVRPSDAVEVVTKP